MAMVTGGDQMCPGAGFDRNDQRLGAMIRAPKKKPTLVRGEGVGVLCATVLLSALVRSLVRALPLQ